MDFINAKDCLNCGAAVDAPFCSQCGQQRAERITLSRLFKIFQKGIFEFKSPLVTTLVGLTIKPSQVYFDYIHGKRISYFNPFKYSFWLLTLLIVVSTFFDTPIYDFSLANIGTPEEEPMLRELEVVMNSAMIYLYFLNGLFTALFYKLFFRKSGYSYAELCIGSLLSFSHFTLVYTILIIFGHYQNINTHFGTVLLLVAYQVWGMGGMFRPVSMSNYMKSFFASVLSVTLFSFISVFSISVVLGFMAGMAE